MSNAQHENEMAKYHTNQVEVAAGNMVPVAGGCMNSNLEDHLDILSYCLADQRSLEWLVPKYV